jgi:hypothetical protein
MILCILNWLRIISVCGLSHSGVETAGAVSQFR